MHQQARSDEREQKRWIRDLYIYLGRNVVQVGILSVLIVGGIITLILQDINKRQEDRKEVKPAWTNKDRLKMKYGGDNCARDPYCRQLKRIWEEGGSSEEAIRKNILAADKSLTFEQVEQNAARYEGTPWAFEGKIFDIIYEEKRGIGDYILAEVIIGDDPERRVSVRGDFRTGFDENDYVYVVGYFTGTSRPQFGPRKPLSRNFKVVGMSARAMLKPSEAREILNGSRTN
jgi:hypothetical protein